MICIINSNKINDADLQTLLIHTCAKSPDSFNFWSKIITITNTQYQKLYLIYPCLQCDSADLFRLECGVCGVCVTVCVV